MDEPWGLSGPEFLALYGAALVIAVTYGLLLRHRVRRPRPPEFVRPVDLAGLAFLTGGPRRVVEVAIARLIETGTLRPSRGGQIAAVAHFAQHPIDTAVLQQTGQVPRQLSDVIRRAAASPAVVAVGDALVDQRLLVAPSVARKVQRRAVLGLHLLLLVGSVRLVNGIMQDYPVLYLVGLLALTVVLTIVLRGKRLPARTVHGDAVVDAATDRDRANPWLGPSLVLTGAAGAVVLGGLAFFPDLLVREALMTHAMANAQSQSWAYASTGSSGCGYTSWSGSDGSGSSGSGDSGGGGGSDSGGGGSNCGGGGGCGGGSGG